MNMDLMTVMLQAAAPAGGGSASFLIMMVLIFAVMYFFMIRPQQKRQKELVKFRNALEKGQKIITAGGIYGTIKEVKENYVLVEVDSNVAIRVDKNMERSVRSGRSGQIGSAGQKRREATCGSSDRRGPLRTEYVISAMLRFS